MNHALGLISLEAMDAGRVWFLWVWRSLLGTVVLYGALAAHMALTFVALYQRRHFRMRFWEALQIALGLLILPFLIPHIIGTRLAHLWFEMVDSYTLMTLFYWEIRPELWMLQSLLLTIVWLHGCIGLHGWLRLKSWYPRTIPLGCVLAVLLPVLALLGFMQAGQEVSRLAQQSGWLQQTLEAAKAPSPSQIAALERVQNNLMMALAACIGLTLIARAARSVYERRHQTFRITYADGQDIRAMVGLTVLEASRRARIPHVAVCGGRGRCSTCRVRVLYGFDALPDSSAEERRVLQRVGAPPDVRLACQLQPTSDVSVAILLPASIQASEVSVHSDYAAGQEREIAVLFADLRRFTQITEHKLPYDVVFLLNRYFEVIGSAIERAGGIANQFTGDGVMALFGVNTGSAEGCRQALVAAREMVQGLAQLSEALDAELEAPLRMGIGIHCGPTVVGRMGRGVALYLTAVGDTVHVASRLQELTKDYRCQMVISESVAERAGVDVTACPRHELTVRNRQEPIVIRTIDDIDMLL